MPTGKILKTLLVLTVAACEPDQPFERKESRKFCESYEERHELKQAIIDCAKAANPLSDEDGEDLVVQCERTMSHVVCPSYTVVVSYDEHGIERSVRFVDGPPKQ